MFVFRLSLFILISQTPLQMCQSVQRWQLYYCVFLAYRISFSIVVCVLIYFFHSNTINSMLICLFASLFIFVYLSIIMMHYFKIINPLQGSIDRTVKEMIKNDMVTDVKELEMFGSTVNEKTVSLFRHSNNESLWMRAFKSVNVKNMKYLLSIDPNIDVNEQDQENGCTAIIYASTKNNINAIKLLLSQPQIDVNKCDNDGYTALIYGVENECFEIIQLLLEAGADVNISPNDTGQSPIICCAIKNNINIAKLLLNESQINVNEYDKNGCSALLYGVKNGYFEMMKLLIESGADINQTEKCDNSIDNNETPLIIALEKNYIEMALWMLDNGIKYGLDTTTPKDSDAIPVRIHCWHTHNQDIVDKYEEFENENKNENSSNENYNYDWISGMRLLNELKNGHAVFACQMLRYSTNSGIKLNTSVTDKNGQTSWVYCWKSKNIELMAAYFQYHKKTNIKWNVYEMDWTKQNNALTFLFSTTLTIKKGSFKSPEEISLFEFVINQFIDDLLLCNQQNLSFEWPPRSFHHSILGWLFSPWSADNDGAMIQKWKKRMGEALPIITEAIVTILHKSTEFSKLEMKAIKTINNGRWVHFLEPSNSLKCIKSFIECNINANHPIKIAKIDQPMYNRGTILDLFVQMSHIQTDNELFPSKYEEMLKWLKYECTISPRKVIKFINSKTKMRQLSPLAHALSNNQYHLAKLILATFEYNVNVNEKYYRVRGEKSKSQLVRSATWLDIVRSKDAELIQLAIVALLNGNYNMNEISSLVNSSRNISIYSGTHDNTPLFWAVNNQLYLILQLMLTKKQNKKSNIKILNPSTTDTMQNSAWEYVTALPNIYKLLEMKENINDEKEMQIEYNIDNIDVPSMKLLIQEHKIDVNKRDSFDNQALFRICGIKYNKNNFDTQFDKQYQAIKLLIENNAKVYEKVNCGNETFVWRSLLLLIMNKKSKLSINDCASVKQYIYAKIFGENENTV